MHVYNKYCVVTFCRFFIEYKVGIVNSTRIRFLTEMAEPIFLKLFWKAFYLLILLADIHYSLNWRRGLLLGDSGPLVFSICAYKSVVSYRIMIWILFFIFWIFAHNIFLQNYNCKSNKWTIISVISKEKICLIYFVDIWNPWHKYIFDK